jgi:hypothetical protein
VITDEFAEGQVWSYHTRPGETGSTILINKIEIHPVLKTIYHIGIFVARVKDPWAPSGVATRLPHFPVSTQTLEKSCIELIGHAEPDPEYLDGYAIWKKEFDQGRAGIFTVTVAEIVDIIETAINQRPT